MSDLIDNFNKARDAIYEHCGFVEDWTVYPIDDRTSMYWLVDKKEREWVKYAEDIDDIINDTGNYYENEIYTQRFYPKWVYRGAEYTLILVDTHTDGNKFFAIYKNSLEMHV